MSRSKIEWTDETWNPIRGCTTVSEGCRNCYAMRQASRFSGPGGAYEGLAKGGKWTGKVRVVESELDRPARWRRPRRCFVCSMSDLFHDAVPQAAIDRVLGTMERAGAHTFQVLTKRPERMARTFRDRRPVPRNVWLGTSVEDQASADARIPHLQRAAGPTPGTLWLSAEPLLGPLDLTRWLDPHAGVGHGPRIGWVVAGGESGPGARPMDPAWIHGVRDQCLAAGVPFLFKQWGEWVPVHLEPAPGYASGWAFEDPRGGISDRSLCHVFWGSRGGAVKVGKRAAGRRLDGRTWDEFPAGVGATA